MTTSNATAVDSAAKTGAEKTHEKLAEKRRALGRGLESLLPGPRAVVTPSPSSADFVREPPGSRVAQAGAELRAAGRAEVRAAAPSAVLEELHGAAGERLYGDVEYRVPLEQVDENPYQTRKEFDEGLLEELADSIREQGVLQPIMVRPGKDGPVHPDFG